MVDRSFEDLNESHHENRGQQWNAETARREFIISGPERRAIALDELDKAINDVGEISPGTEGFKTAAERVTLKRELKELHLKMLAVRR